MNANVKTSGCLSTTLSIDNWGSSDKRTIKLNLFHRILNSKYSGVVW